MQLAERKMILPVSLPPRGLSRIEAAAFVGVSPTLFDEMVRDGRMPQPKLVNARVIWDRIKVEAHFEALPERDSPDAGPKEDPWANWKP